MTSNDEEKKNKIEAEKYCEEILKIVEANLKYHYIQVTSKLEEQFIVENTRKKIQT